MKWWYEIGGENVEEGVYVTQRTQYLHGVHLKNCRDVARNIYKD